jgi:Sortase domain
MTGRNHLTGPPGRRRVRRYGLGAAAVAVLVVTGITSTRILSTGPPETSASRASAGSAAAAAFAQAVTVPAKSAAALLPPLPHGPEGPAHPAARIVAAALPVRLSIPSIGVNTGLESLQLLPDHTLAAPRHWAMAGWYSTGVRPGDAGPAIIAGHVDSVSGPAVFFRLRQLRPGAVVLVGESTGSTLRFVVDSATSYPKDHFPTEAVYGPTPLPELRLITCTGDFDFSAHSYRDNLVVSAHLS